MTVEEVAAMFDVPVELVRPTRSDYLAKLHRLLFRRLVVLHGQAMAAEVERLFTSVTTPVTVSYVPYVDHDR